MRCDINNIAVAVILSVLNGVGVNASAALTESENDMKIVLRKEMMSMVGGSQKLIEQNFLVGIASLAAVYENQTQCGQELEIMLNAINRNEVWGLKVLDSFGSPPKTFIWGNYFWFGTPDLCDDLNKPFTISLSRSKPLFFNATSPFPVQFVVVYLNFTTPYYIDMKLPFKNYIHLGLCFPKSCSVSKISFYADAYFGGEYFEMQRNFKLQLKVLEAKVPHFSWKYFTKSGSAFFIIIMITTNALGIIADFVYKSRRNLNVKHLTHSKCQADGGDDATNNFKQERKSPLWEELLICFRFSLNFETVMSLENLNSNSKYFTALAGMRSIICLWITVFHVYYYSLFVISNTSFIFAKLEAFSVQPIIQACFYVDVFFIMSSFLLVYNFLSNTKMVEQIRCSSWWSNFKLFIRSLLQRYMRLTPVMIVTMLLSTAISDLLNMYSPFRLTENSGFYCKTNWWYNLLYIHNFLDMNNICCSWTWYLACEIQFFILFTALLFVHVKKPIVAKIVFVTLALGFVVCGWFANFTNGIKFEIDVIYSTLNQLYVKPWVRIPPYFGGATMGWLMYRMQQHQCQYTEQQQHDGQEQQYSATIAEIHNPQQRYQIEQEHQKYHHHHKYGHTLERTFWFICLVIYVTTNFMSYWRSMPSWLVATIMSIGKLFFALCVGGVIAMCACGRGGGLNVLLSSQPFLFLNKFCFSIYMLAPTIVVAIYGLRNEPTTFTEVGSFVDFVAGTVLSILSAFIIIMLIELPMQRIANRLLK